MPEEPQHKNDTEPLSGSSQPPEEPKPEMMPAVESEPTTHDTMPAGVPSVQQANTYSTTPKSKKKWIIAGVAAGLLTLLVGVSVFAYTMFQNPDRVLDDALLNLISRQTQPTIAKANAHYTSKEGTVTITMDSKQASDQKGQGTASITIESKDKKVSPQPINISAEFVSDGKNIVYIKLKNVKHAVDAYIESLFNGETLASLSPAEKQQMKAAYKQQYEAIAAKIDDQWIKIDIDQNDASNATGKCYNSVMTSLAEDRTVQSEVMKVYGKNRFVTIKKQLGNKDGNIGFELDIDRTKAKDFGKAIKETEFGKKLLSCNKEALQDNSTTSSTTDKATTTVSVWIDQWSHKFKAVDVDGKMNDDAKGAVKMHVDLGYDKVGSVSIPSNAKDIKQVGQEIQELMSGSNSASGTYNSI